MKSIIKLSDNLINQIAAGEIINNPSSVVKELIENSIDAKSNKIDIIIEEFGLKKIQICDNGVGIYKDDILNVFKHHTTSKILKKDDLFDIKTLGFRGEALASIASISEVILETCNIKEKNGSFLKIKGGKILEKKENIFRIGTKIIVNNLFFNTPVRLKYLKSSYIEISNIINIVNKLALGNPKIMFNLFHNKKRIINTIGNNSLIRVISDIYNIEIAKKMFLISNKNIDFRIFGYISSPEITRSNNNHISFFINGRYIKNFFLNNAIIKAYDTLLMIKKFPIVILYIKVSNFLLDINIHPTKEKIKISKEKALFFFIYYTIKKIISKKNLIFSIFNNSKLFNNNFKKENNNKKKVKNFINKKLENENFINKKENKKINKINNNKNKFPKMEYIVQIYGMYLLTQNKDNFFIIDQHAAEERVKYEYFMYKFKKINLNINKKILLYPIILEYSIDEILKIKKNIKKINKFGINIIKIYNKKIIINSYPNWFPINEEKNIICKIIEEILYYNYNEIFLDKIYKKIVMFMSCKKSIKSNFYLSRKYIMDLLKRLSICKNPFNCPHGRPILLTFNIYDINKMFKRN